MAVRSNCIAGLIFVAGLVVSPALALDPARAVNEYAITTWQQDLPQNTVPSLAQTPDGYLWIGTHEGLVRFDGISFRVFDRDNTPELPSNSFLELFVDSLGGLWGGGFNGIVRFDGRSFRSFESKDGYLGTVCYSIREDPAGDVWVGSDRGLFRYRGGRFEQIGEKFGIPPGTVRKVEPVGPGDLWLGMDSGVVSRFRDGRFEVFKRDGVLPGAPIMAMHWQASSDTLWVGTDGGGLVRIRGDHADRLTTKQGLSADLVRAIAADSHGVIWVGTDGGGLNRISDGRIQHLMTGDGLSNDLVRSLLEDREGSLWIGTNGGGLNRLSDSKFVAYTLEDGLSGSNVRAVMQDKSGAMWIGTDGGGVTLIRDGLFTSLRAKDGLAGDYVRAIFQDSRGDVWLGTNGNGVSRIRGRAIRTFGPEEALPRAAVTAIAETRDGVLWIGTTRGLVRAGEEKFVTAPDAMRPQNSNISCLTVDRKGQLWIGTITGLTIFDGTASRVEEKLAGRQVFSVFEAPSGDVWIATDRGISRSRDGNVRHYGAEEGLYGGTTLAAIDDGLGYIWVSTNKGILRVSRTELDEIDDKRRDRALPWRFDRNDGMPSSQCNGVSQPAVWQARDQKLWFPTIAGAAVIDPAGIKRNPIAPPVVIERVIVDGASIPMTGPIVFPAGSKRFEFQYTGLTFNSPTRVRFRCRLEGQDDSWIDSETAARPSTQISIPASTASASSRQTATAFGI